MKIFLRKILDKLKNPPVWCKIVNFVSTIVFVIASLYFLAFRNDNAIVSAVSYVVFALSALSLSYTIFIMIVTTPKIKRNVVRACEKNKFTDRLLKNYDFRTVIFTIGSFLANAFFGIFNGFMGIKYNSVWYRALACYYILLALIRGSVLGYHKKNSGEQTTGTNSISQAKLYRRSGIALLILNLALFSAVVQIVVSGAHFTYVGWLIFAYATYAFYKMSMAIINIVRARSSTDLTIKVIRDINLTAASVSLLALQTALLSAFADENVNAGLLNAFSGIAVCLFTVGLGIYMIVSANKIIQSLKTETDENEQQI